MSFLDWLAENGIFEVKRLPQRPEKKPHRILDRAATPDELTLGFADGEDEDGNEVSKMKGVPQSDRITHFYVIGASGTGKTKFLEHLISQDIFNKSGFGIIDPHGDLVNRTKELLAFCWGQEGGLEERVVLIDPTDKEYTVSFNPLELTEGYNSARQALELVEVFHRIWGKSWGDRMADILRNSLIALIENNLTLKELLPFLTDAQFRAKLLLNVKNETCLDYFKREFNELNPKTRGEWITSTSNKVRAFLADPTVEDMFLSTKSSFNFREVIDSGKILLVRIPKGLLGDENSRVLGSLIMSKIQMAAFSRADTDFDDRIPYYLYIDEFQNFAAENFTFILDESRKYKLALTLAHQNLSQVSREIRSSVLNCPLQAYFRVLREDAEILAKEMFVGITATPEPWEIYFQKLQLLQTRECYVKNKNGGGIALITVPPAVQIDKEMEKMHGEAKASLIKEFLKMKKTDIGTHYLRERESVWKEYRARMQVLTGSDEPEGYRRK